MPEVSNDDLVEDENRAHFALWYFTKAPLLLSMDVTVACVLIFDTLILRCCIRRAVASGSFAWNRRDEGNLLISIAYLPSTGLRSYPQLTEERILVSHDLVYCS